MTGGPHMITTAFSGDGLIFSSTTGMSPTMPSHPSMTPQGSTVFTMFTSGRRSHSAICRWYTRSRLLRAPYRTVMVP